MKKWLKINDYEDCVLLKNQETGYYTVKERFDGDSIITTTDGVKAREVAENYKFKDIVKIRYEKFAEYLKRVTE